MKYLKTLISLFLFALLIASPAFVKADNDNDDDNSGRRNGTSTVTNDDDDDGDDDSKVRTNFGIGGKENEGLRKSSFTKIKIGGDDEKGLNKKQVIDRRFNWAIESLNNLYTRLGKVITTLSDAGIDETDAKAKLVAAKTKIDDAGAKVKELVDFVAGIKAANASGSTASSLKISTADLQNIRAKAKTAKEAIKAAHQALMETKKAIVASIGLAKDDSDDDSDSDN